MTHRITKVVCKPTNYRGILFRSKSEANAANYMDRLGIRWLYEHESYLLDGEQYTPDFYLPEIDTLIEIKPEIFNAEIDRIREFVPHIGKKLAVLTPDLRVTDLCYRIYDADIWCPERKICVREGNGNDPFDCGEYWTWASWCENSCIYDSTCPICGHPNWLGVYGHYNCVRCGGRIRKADDWQFYHHKTAATSIVPMSLAREIVSQLKNSCGSQCKH